MNNKKGMACDMWMLIAFVVSELLFSNNWQCINSWSNHKMSLRNESDECFPFTFVFGVRD